MGLLRPLDPASSFGQMVDFVSSCKGAVPRKKFNRLSNKSYRHLYGEFCEGVDIAQDMDTGEAVRVAMSVKTFIFNPTEKHFILEVSRTYPNGRTVENYTPTSIEKWSISETMKKGECAQDCAVRGLIEELGFNSFLAHTLKVEVNPRPTFSSHPSTAFLGVRSDVTSFWCDIETHQLSPNIKLKTIRDNGTIINRVWVDDSTPHCT